MKLNVGGRNFSFRFDEYENYNVCRGVLESWSGFRSENSREGLVGKNVLFALESETYDTHPRPGPIESYSKALAWLFANESAVKEAALAAVLKYIDVVRNDYGIDDDELNTVKSSAQLTSIIDLTFVHIFPHSKDGIPYLGLVFECNWDLDGGCGVLLYGTSVVEAGNSDVAHSIETIEEHGGTA
jgi:hypothetical protein